MSVVVVLADDVDVGRGDLLAHTPPLVATRFQATVVWMDERPLEPRRLYLLKHGTRWVLAQSDRPLALNEIAAVTIDATRPLPLDLYELNRRTGRFILVDPDTNFTSGAGMITAGLPGHRARASALPAAVRLASVARAAASETDAVEAVNRALAEMLT